MSHICRRCSRQFGSIGALQQHTAVNHPSVTAHAPNHPCHNCSRQFNTKEALDQHISAAHRTPSHTCSQCNRLFHSREALNQHSLNSHRTPNIPCQDCNKLFHSREALSQHSLDSHRTPNIPCQDCNKLFHSRDALGQHTQVSHPKYPCHECGKILASQESLNQHKIMKHSMTRIAIPIQPPPATYRSPVYVSQGGLSAPVTSHSFPTQVPNLHPFVTQPRAQTNPEHVEIAPPNNHNTVYQRSASLPQVPSNPSRVDEILPPWLHPTPSASPPNETEPKVYQNLMSLLLQKALLKDLVVPTLLDDLRAQRSKMRGRDVIASLVNSNEYLSDLMKVSHALECPDFEIREALKKDKTNIVNLLQDILNSDEDKKRVLLLRGSEAESFLTFMDNIIAENGSLFRGDGEAESRSTARRLLVKLSETCGILPSSLNISGVKDCETEAVGAGGFADIYRASYNGEYVALKRLREYESDTRQNARRLFCREALVWQDLKHANVLPFYGIDISTFCPRMCMVSPWMENGTILRYIKNSSVPLRANSDIDRFLYEIAQGIFFLHSKGVVHGDLRGSNILVDKDGHVRVADFGLTGFQNATLASKTTNRNGSIQWMAPELLDPERYGLDRFKRTTNSDVYAFACVCSEIHTLKNPFGDLHDGPVILKVVSYGERPGRPTGADERPMSNDLWALVEECWKDIRKGQRPNMAQVIMQIQRTWHRPSTG